MRRLSAVTLAWRNFLYANPAGYCNNPEDLCARVSLIQDEREAILNQMLKDEPNMNEIQMSKEEIAFQIENLEEMADEFACYADCYHFYETTKELQHMVLDNLLNNGTESEFYIVADEWKTYAENADMFVRDMKEQFGYVVNGKEQRLLRQLMDLQIRPEERENLQTAKKQLEERIQQSIEKYFFSEESQTKNIPVAEDNHELAEEIIWQMTEEMTRNVKKEQEYLPAAESDMELAEEMSEEEAMLLEAQADQGMAMER
ncbi:MAG: hypothetical protein NC089_09350 [Bacteroides sp.]|nr:hypothetical protein [Bacteroides sp.]MCM1549638.1 hypothetical protein [Clostridium sp.]